MDGQDWVDELKARAYSSVYACADTIVEELVEHDRGCPGRVMAECAIAFLGYTASSFMVAWSAGEFDER